MMQESAAGRQGELESERRQSVLGARLGASGSNSDDPDPDLDLVLRQLLSISPRPKRGRSWPVAARA